MSSGSGAQSLRSEFPGPIGSWYTTKIKPRENEKVLWGGRASRINLESRANNASFGALILTNKRLLYAPNVISIWGTQLRVGLDEISKVETKSRFAGGLRKVLTQRGYRPRLKVSITDQENPQLFVVPNVEGAAEYIREEIV